MVFLPVGFGALFLLMFIIKCRKQRSVQGVYIKNITSIFFIMTAIYSCYKNPAQWQYGVFLLGGLVFGMLGDIYLDLKWVYPDDMKQYLNLGFINFGLGHVFYIGAIIHNAEFSIKHILISVAVGVVVALGNLILEKPMKLKFGEFKPILTLYGFILATMTGAAVVAAIKTGYTAFIVYAVGAVLFLLSDLILSPMYFGEGKNTPTNFVLNHVTYYAGQYLIALSIFFMPAAAGITQ